MNRSITLTAAALIGAATLATSAVAAAAAPSAAGPPAAARAPFCGIHWGSQPKVSVRSEGPATAQVTGVRPGRHACFDRLVIELGPGVRPGYRVSYVRAFFAQGSGQVIPLRGGAKLEIVLRDGTAPGFPASGRELANVHGYQTLRQVAGGGSFEGYTDLGIGVRARLPFALSSSAAPAAAPGW